MKYSIAKEIESVCLALKPEDSIKFIEKVLKCNLIVKQHAQVHIGKIITSIEENELIQSLLKYYYAIPTMDYFSNIDKENAWIQFVEIFPTVLAKINVWADSKNSFMISAYSQFPSVRLAVCKSLPSIAQIIGKENTAQDLCPILEKCMRDQNKSIRLCCFKSLSKFFIHIPQKQQLELDKYLKTIKVAI